MSIIKQVSLHDGTLILIEMEEADIPQTKMTDNYGLPEEAEPAGVADKVIDTMQSLQETLGGIFQVIQNSIKDKSPSEWGVELNIGFKGKTNPMPVILSAEANASIKIHAKWIESTQELP